MRPKQQQKARHDDLFRARLDQIINLKQELVVLTEKIDWAWLDEQLADCFSDQGRPAEPGHPMPIPLVDLGACNGKSSTKNVSNFNEMDFTYLSKL